MEKFEKSRTLKMFILLSIILYLLVISYLPLSNYNVFQAPDENSNHIATMLYAETGKLYYFTNYSRLDYENYLHPRHFITCNNRTGLTQFFGLPIIYGTIYLFFGENIDILFAVFFSLLSLIFFVKTSSLFFPKSEIYSIIVFLSILPLTYYFNHPYFNVTPTISFFIIGFYYLTKFYKFECDKYYLLSALFFSISMFCRNNYGIFIFLLLVCVLINKYKNKKILILKYLLVSGVLAVVFAVLPTVFLNYEIYGSSLLHGNALLNKYIIGLPPSSHNPVAIFFPSPFIPDIVLKNIDRLILKFLPILSILSIIGLLRVIKEKKWNKYYLCYVIFFIYLLCYRGSSNTYYAYNFNYIGFNVSIIRYWLIIYLFLALFAVGGLLAISKINKKIVTILIIAVLLITSINTLFMGTQCSLTHEYDTLSLSDEIALEIQKEINKKSIVYCSYYDKILNPYSIEVAAWWGHEAGYDPIKLTDSMIRMHKNTDFSLYLCRLDNQKYVDVYELNKILKNENLKLENTNVKNLYELVPL